MTTTPAATTATTSDAGAADPCFERCQLYANDDVGRRLGDGPGRVVGGTAPRQPASGEQRANTRRPVTKPRDETFGRRADLNRGTGSDGRRQAAARRSAHMLGRRGRLETRRLSPRMAPATVAPPTAGREKPDESVPHRPARRFPGTAGLFSRKHRQRRRRTRISGNISTSRRAQVGHSPKYHNRLRLNAARDRRWPALH